jgi:pilus assembly protein CpaB
VRRQSIIALAAAVFFGLIAVFLVNAYLTGAEKQQTAQEVATVKVGVARVALPFGEQLTPEKVRFVDWPRSSVPPGALQAVGDLNSNGKPRMVLRPLEVGEPILRSKVTGEGGRATLSAIIPADRRGLSMRVNDVAGVAGFVLPGDRVDVLITRTIGETQVTDVLLQDVKVLAIDQSANDQATKPDPARTVTFEVDPYDAQKLVLAAQIGSLSLALRSAEAPVGDSYSEPVSIADLGGFGGGSSYVPASGPSSPPVFRRPTPTRIVRAPAKPEVEIVRGVASSKYEVSRYAGK